MNQAAQDALRGRNLPVSTISVERPPIGGIGATGSAAETSTSLRSAYIGLNSPTRSVPSESRWTSTARLLSTSRLTPNISDVFYETLDDGNGLQAYTRETRTHLTGQLRDMVSLGS